MGVNAVKRNVLYYAVSGYKNTGKTTLITKLIPLLIDQGYKVAAIKHDGHDFIPDVPGTDSFRMRGAGACGVGVFSDKRLMIIKESEAATAELLAEAFPEADVILLEGFKGKGYPGCICRYPEAVPDVADVAADILQRLRQQKQ